jgi:tellurite resistance protein TerC
MYFLLAAVVHKFHLLKYGLALILTFVGVKMLLVDIYKVPIMASLAVILGVLVLSVVGSLMWPQAEQELDVDIGEGEETTGSIFGKLPADGKH